MEKKQLLDRVIKNGVQQGKQRDWRQKESIKRIRQM